VLDNFEQLVATSAELVRGWCSAAPELVILVTSRERLGIDGEVVIELEPLLCPPTGAPLEKVLASEAVQLLAVRAAAAGAELGGDAKAIAELVRELDGIPLAIELAAARIRVLAPAELNKRLAQSSAILGRPSRASTAAEARHATLSSAIEWSWNLLAPHEQRALAECTVFPESFTLEAAEQVLGQVEGSPPLVDVICALRDKSLIHAVPSGLALYVSIRDFAAERLASFGADAIAVVDRHARYFAAAAQAFSEARTFQTSEPDGGLRSALTRDRKNLLAALAHVRAQPPAMREPTIFAELALGASLLNAAATDVCYEALSEALAAGDRLPESLRVRMLLARQGLASSLGRYDESRADLETLLAIQGLAPGIRALVLVEQGVQRRYFGHSRAAWESHLEADRWLDAAHAPSVKSPPRVRVMNLACIGRLLGDLDDGPRALEYNERARGLALSLGDPLLEGCAVANLGQLAQERGQLDRAESLLAHALECFRTACEPHYEAVYGLAYGELLFERGRHDEARVWFEAADQFFRGWLAHRQTAMLHALWAALEAQVGDLPAAEEHLAVARQRVDRVDNDLVRLAVEIHAQHVMLARGGAGGAAVVRTRMHELVAARAELVETSFDLRFAVRLLTRALTSTSGEALRVGRNCAWFEARGRPRAELARRGSLKRILAALVEAHRTRPDCALGRDALLAHGWPGERLLPEAAGTRLRVAIATLRSLGLRDVLLTREDGYLLDPRVEIRAEGPI
jgi:predicted ATPase